MCWFGQILTALLIHTNKSSLLQKFHCPIEDVLKSLQKQKGLELLFRPQILQNFLINFFLLQYDLNWPIFINSVYFPSYSVKCISYFILRHLMMSRNLKFWNLIFWRTKFHKMIALQNLWKILFISSKKLFSFSRYSNFYIFIPPSFSPCWPLL